MSLTTSTAEDFTGMKELLLSGKLTGYAGGFTMELAEAIKEATEQMAEKYNADSVTLFAHMTPNTYGSYCEFCGDEGIIDPVKWVVSTTKSLEDGVVVLIPNPEILKN